MPYVAAKLTDEINMIVDKDIRERSQWVLEHAIRDMFEWQRHLIRCSQQRKGRMELVKNLKAGEGNIFKQINILSCNSRTQN